MGDTNNKRAARVERAARLAVDIVVAQLWQQTRSPEDAVEAICDVIELNGGVAAMRTALERIVAESDGGKAPSPAAIEAARKALVQ
jgi:hypothetical protein